jgi:fused signal recognition particle receptor
MFEKLKTAFSNAAKTLSEKELNEKDVDTVLSELELSLLESDVAFEVIDLIKTDLKQKLIGSKVDRKEVADFVKNSVIQNISNLFEAAGNINLISKIKEKKEPFVILFVGINGTGKTTTLAKVAHLLQKSKLSVVVAAADTFRAGAIEQLKEHTNRLNVKLVAQNYGSDPAAVARDAVLYAKAHKVDCVLIDTAGRMQTSKNLMDQISKINKVVNPDMRIFVGDSLAGNDTVSQAREFFNHVKFDGSILTKIDADARGGAALSIVKITSTPILYVGIGQEYDDLAEFNKDVFLETVFGTKQVLQKTETVEVVEKITEKKLEEQTFEKKLQPPPTPEIKPTSEEPKTAPPKQEVYEDKDPFEGIATDDINLYAKLYDVPPPESDDEAVQLASKIKKWIQSGRPKPSKEQELKESEKTKKKKSFFGVFRK